MELREFAEQVLFSTSLDEKLRAPENIADENPGQPMAVPPSPGRPANLNFKPHAGGKSEFPGLHRLEAEPERGKLLHFFGNHELLATELMALVLLRFPQAPAAFRRGVFQTLKDEQEHTRLYMERMKACGVELGDLPVSGYFWRCVAPMENPIDYVAGLCLTFEQANLDFALHFSRSFAAVGDTNTARLLEKIYRDEIGHVAYGLKWFRRWKNPNESDWEAFCQALKFPLSPQRAKGITLNVEGRLAAGLDPQFIAELNVYSQSKGRTPSVFVFNPFAEGYLANGRAYNPTKRQAQLAQDLECLPQFLCRQDDVVLVRRRPSVEFLSGIKQAGYPLPEFVELPDAAWRSANAGSSSPAAVAAAAAPENVAAPGMSSFRNLTSRKLGRLRPWAWGHDSFELLQPLFASVAGEKRDGWQFDEGLARLYSKAWSADFLRAVLARHPAVPWLCAETEVGVAVDSAGAATAAIAAIRERGHHKIVVKEALGVAGSDALRLFEPHLLETQCRWLANASHHNRRLVVEPWLERELDFSIQLEMGGHGLKLCGFTGLINDTRGQFQANYAEPHHHQRIPSCIAARFDSPTDIASQLLEFYDDVFSLLESELKRAGFTGPIGIDAFIYRDARGAVRLKPVVEINPRYTMGRLTVELMRQTCQASAGRFRLINPAILRQEGFADFPAYAVELARRFPVQFEGEPAPRIRSGAICLNDPNEAKFCLAVFQVARNINELGLELDGA
jgi:uncharacterized ferritin-like protein (DUF455 family)